MYRDRDNGEVIHRGSGGGTTRAGCVARRPRLMAEGGTGRNVLGRLHAGLGQVAIGLVARLKRPITLGVRVVAVNAAGDVLLIRHSYRPGLYLPGGGVEVGESCAEAAIRECREEAHLEVPAPLRLFHVYHNLTEAGRGHVVLFAARDVWQRSAVRPGLEILSAAFYPPDALPEATTRATRARIAEVLEDRPPPEHW